MDLLSRLMTSAAGLRIVASVVPGPIIVDSIIFPGGAVAAATGAEGGCQDGLRAG
jgi:hypothetical protein